MLIRFVPGDPVMLLLGERGADPEVYEKMKTSLGLNRPLYQQYGSFVTGIFRGDLGTSVISKRPVLREFLDRFPATFELGMVGMIFAVIFGIPLGILAAIKRGKVVDYGLMGASLVGYSMPIFWWGLILILIFSVHLGITPVSGRINVMYEIEPITGLLLIDTWLSGEGFGAFWSAVKSLILPSIAMGTIPLAVTARMTRSSMLEVMGEDYIRTAKAKGMPYWKIVVVHALRNALIPIITVLGLMFGSIITGAILTETIFSWPGIGKWMVASINARDYLVIQGGVMIIAGMIVMTNFVVDILYSLANPRMRGQS
jgi:dipeptide transport system permease protein